MRNTKFYLLIIFFYCISCNKIDRQNSAVLIIPKPVFQEFSEGSFLINKKTTLQSDEAFTEVSEYLKDMVFKGTGIELKGSREAKSNTIILEKDQKLKNESSYTLEINQEKIKITAADTKGAFYGIQTLRQIFPSCIEDGSCTESEIALQALKIEDEARFEYRGMHLDVGRHFFKVSDIKKYIDMLALLKMNTFHWHLTEDQGWRIEIKKYPKLTEIAAFRKETLIGHYNDQPQQFDGKRYGGFYTQEEIKEVVAYAAERQITVIPEIEMPGHSQAAIAAYPELGCTGNQVEVATKWGVFDEVYCPHEKTFTFLQDVLDEVMALFPSEYIHIGGDEAPKNRWKNCQYCQQLIAREDLKDEHGLQSYFIKRIEKYLNGKGRQIIGWDEILEGGLAPNATVMSWRGVEGAITAANEGHKVVMTPTSHCYFDYYQSDDENEPLAIGGFLPLQKVYDFEPIPEILDEEASKLVLGAQGNVWTEYMPDFDKVSYMAFPRAIALSEVVWSQKENKDYLNFVSRLEYFQERLDHMGIKYANHLYEIEGGSKAQDDALFYELSTFLPGKEIRYAINDEILDEQAKIYQNPIRVEGEMMLKAAVFDNGQLQGEPFVQKINQHKATTKKITLNPLPHEAYNAGGKEALINGVRGSDKRYGDKEWLGFWGEDVEIIIDLEKKTPLKQIVTRFYHAPGQWIYAPELLELKLYENDLNDAPLVSKHLNKIEGGTIVETIMERETEARFVKIVVRNFGEIPEGNQGAGNKAWTFIDEIIIE